MSCFRIATAVATAVQLGAASGVTLATFDGAAGTTFTFTELNDPVMGGKSTGTWTLDSKNKVGIFDGDVEDVPSLKAPGFIKAAANGKFPDASSALAGSLVLTVRSTTPEYQGFRVSFASGTLAPSYACAGGGSIPLSRGCFKAQFAVTAGDAFQTIKIPFSSFSDMWSPATGKQTKTCAEDKDVCPTAEKLAAIKRLEVWAEGVDGKAHLEIQSIAADATAVSLPTAPRVTTDTEFITFDGAERTTFKFVELNDPVMGGKSTGTVTLQTIVGNQQLLVFDGQVADVPSLKAPGFISAHADGKFIDLSSFAGGDLVLTVRASGNAQYDGWKVSLASGTLSPTFACAAGGGLPFSRGCYKAPFAVPVGNEFVNIRVPFATFTDRWSSTTGKPVASCAEDPTTCLTAQKLKKVLRFEFMAEGVDGKVHLEVKAVAVAPASDVKPRTSGEIMV